MTFDDRLLVPLGQVTSEYGGKAVQLRRLIERGLPVPDGFAISSEAVLEFVASSVKADPLLHTVLQSLGATTVANAAQLRRMPDRDISPPTGSAQGTTVRKAYP